MQFVIYAIKQEVCEHYYYKVELLKRFFEECIRLPQSKLHQKQLDYITEDFSFKEWLGDLCKGAWVTPFSQHKNGHLFNYEQNYDIILTEKSCCLLQCDSLWQAERVLFQPLRMCDQTFFIVEENGEHYGWVSPLSSQRLLS
ncbi:sporulation inhibitor of replication protein SirA [Halobacillus shinanisalinarum]|uniref:Sporulation inhibitor of replication protein SirA n=1 Tax=Halobacillus shinanisalinarum TaxID=2932258 RepID=A0ABY4H1B0_9BACI|nr:sporulation inhibitor of replication protein SirA [Halobacillus shinanisalinarum]UOQ93437.1 sporulation inhibitor of replication protein SirA [Halobacillus shinanisalinarum]